MDSPEIGDEPTTSRQRLGNSRRRCMPKRKSAPSYRFYALYDKVYRGDVLAYAYERCRSQRRRSGRGRADVRGHRGVRARAWLEELAQELKGKTYRPQAVRRVWIPKADGKQRPLGIPTIRDRVVQMAAVLVLEPIFEADLPPEQYAYRAERSAARMRCGRSKAAGSRLYGGGRCGLERLLRQHPAPRTDEVGGASGQRSASAASAQDVAGSAGRGNRRAGRTAANDPQQGRRPRHAARAAWRRRCWRICTCDDSCWAGRSGARAASGGSHRQLCGRLRDLLPTGPGR